MRSKWYAMVMAVLLIAALSVGLVAGCAGETTTVTQTQTATVTQTMGVGQTVTVTATAPAATVTKTVTATAAPPTLEPIKWGTIQPLTGFDHEEAMEVVHGIQSALDEANGQAAGRRIELIIEDMGEWDVALGVAKGKKLILQDKVDMMVGDYLSFPALGFKDLLIENEILFIGAWGVSAEVVREQYFRNHFFAGYDTSQAFAVTGFAAYDQGYRKAIIMHPDFDIGRDAAADFKKVFEHLGGQVVQEIYTPMGELDYSAYLLQADIRNADVIQAFYFGGMATAFFKQYLEAGLKERIPLFGWGVFDDDNLDVLIEQGLGEEAVGQRHALGYTRALDIPENIEWRQRMVQMYGEDYADYGTANGYIAAKLAIEAIEAVNGDTSDLDGMIEFLETGEWMTPKGYFSYGYHHVPTQDLHLLEVVKENGKIFNKRLQTYPRIPFDWMPD